jgi:type II secretory pathway component PulM
MDCLTSEDVQTLSLCNLRQLLLVAQRDSAPRQSPIQIKLSDFSPRKKRSNVIIVVASLLYLLLWLPGAEASYKLHHRKQSRERLELRIRDARASVATFAQNFSNNLAVKLEAQDIDGTEFAHNLVAAIISSVCNAHAAGTAPSDFTPSVLQDCIRTVYEGAQLQSPPERFLATFGASILCDYVVSGAYPVAEEFAVIGCEKLQDLLSTMTPKGSVATTSTSNSVGLRLSESPARTPTTVARSIDYVKS